MLTTVNVRLCYVKYMRSGNTREVKNLCLK